MHYISDLAIYMAVFWALLRVLLTAYSNLIPNGHKKPRFLDFLDLFIFQVQKLRV